MQIYINDDNTLGIFTQQKPELQIDVYSIFKPKIRITNLIKIHKVKEHLCLKNFYAARLSSEQGAEDIVKKYTMNYLIVKNNINNAFIASKKITIWVMCLNMVIMTQIILNL